MSFIIDSEPWMDEAACASGAATADYDIFFPEDEKDKGPAMRFCNSCPVKEQCLDYALRKDINYGIWGGFNSKERRKLVRMGLNATI